jgi:Tfp pilus assembly protein PilO
MIAGNTYIVRHILKSPAVLSAVVLICLNLGLTLWGTLVLAPDTEHLQTAINRQEKALENRNDPETSNVSKEIACARDEKVLREFFAGMPAHADLPALIEELFDYADKLDLTIARVNYQPKQLAEQRLVQYGLDFQLEGSYDQIKHMIFLLENSPRTIAINKVQFQRRTTQAGKVVLGLDLETWFRGEAP